jgi:hypothetical protein
VSQITAALFTVATRWKKSSIPQQTMDKQNVYLQQGTLSYRKKEVLVHTRAPVNLEDVMLSDRSQTQEMSRRGEPQSCLPKAARRKLLSRAWGGGAAEVAA